MGSAETQFESFALVPPAVFAGGTEDLTGLRSHASPRLVGLSHSALLKARDFVLPELVEYAENGDLSVGGCVDQVQVEQVFQLAEIREEPLREFASLSFAEQQLAKRQHQDWLKRQACRSEPAEDLDFIAWWNRREEKRRTALVRKANRLANCGVTGRRLDCSEHSDEHRFYGSFNCGVRYCRSCGPRIFSELFGKYMGLWPIVQPLVVSPGFRSSNVIATLDFTAVNLGRMPKPEEIREFNQDVRACVRKVTEGLGLNSKQFLFLYCDEFGGWDSKTETYNTNLHAHGVFVGPFIPYKVLLETWVSLRAEKDGARGVFIKKQKLDHQPSDTDERERRRFARALGHALKYTGKHVMRSDGTRLAQLEAAFQGVRRVHTMGLAYRANLSCPCQCEFCGKVCDKHNGHESGHRCKMHRSENRCPLCPGYLMHPKQSGYAPLSELRRERRIDLEKARREVNRERVFAGPRGDPE
jgi:hypothetical protein